jgi:hypothetical protein
MTLFNATLTRISTPTPPNAAGRSAIIAGEAISVRCAMTEVTERDRREIGATIAEATSVLRVLMSNLADEPVKGSIWTVALDGQGGLAAKERRVEWFRPWVKAGGLSHWEVYVR